MYLTVIVPTAGVAIRTRSPANVPAGIVAEVADPITALL
jgi:hypothetical protein